MDKLKKIKQLALANQATLITDTVKQYNEYYEFEDLEGKRFEIRCHYLDKKGWPKNLVNYLKLTNIKSDEEKYNELKSIVEGKGGKVLTSSWLGYKNKHDFLDEDGIFFISTPERIKNNYWSPGRGLVAEPICRQLMEHLFGYQFIKTQEILQPHITGRKKSLELDGYCEELKIAFEYQGHSSHWDSNHRNYHLVIEKDNLKKICCEKLGILLIVIPVFSKTITKLKINEIKNYVLKIVKEYYLNKNVQAPMMNEKEFNIDYSKIHQAKKRIKQFKLEIEACGGELVSKIWHGNSYDYDIKWNDGRIFKMNYNRFKINGWPKNLDKYLALSQGHKKTSQTLLRELSDIAKQNGGKLITKQWLGNNVKHEFETSDGVIFFRSPNTMKYRGWVKIVKKNLLIEDEIKFKYMIELANREGFKLVTKNWQGSKYKYIFENEKDVVLNLSYLCLKNGWPSELFLYEKPSNTKEGKSEYYFNNMKEIAKKNNCRLLSTEWKGNKHRYLFEYEDGEQFTATYIYLKVKKFKNFEV